ncbi:MAG: nitrile hydratase subunit alpha [Sinobacteraceae bacterium]|nr:nitrile hydratase subunit alpha [Nevskiaceae bacterium]
MGAKHHHEPPSDLRVRVRAIESLLLDKGLVDSDAMDKIAQTYEKEIGPRRGAEVVAHAWVNPDYRKRLLENGTAAIGELGYLGLQGEEMIVLENTPQVHNMVVCTLCSCYPWAVLGLPPVWYKSAPYRSRVVIDPRGVLAEFGITLPDTTEVRVWDSNSELRYMVLPMRPEGTNDMSEEDLMTLVTRDSMIGTGLAKTPAEVAA